MKKDSLNFVERVKAPTPKWFKIIRNVGITLTAVDGAILGFTCNDCNGSRLCVIRWNGGDCDCSNDNELRR